MVNIILVDNYLKILNEIGRWKIISLKDLYKNLKVKESYVMFTKRVKSLEEEGFLKSLTGTNRCKYVHLTFNGMKYSKTDVPLIEKSTMNHDLITTTVINKLLDHETFLAGNIPVYEDGVRLEPDGILHGVKNGHDFTMALEVELTQKSKRRVIEKLVEYAESRDFDYCLYVMNKESVFKSYQKIINSMESDIKRKIVFLLDKELSSRDFNFLDAECYFDEENRKFGEVIG